MRSITARRIMKLEPLTQSARVGRSAMGSTEAAGTPAEAAAGEAAMSEIVEGGEGKAGGETPSEEALPKRDGQA